MSFKSQARPCNIITIPIIRLRHIIPILILLHCFSVLQWSNVFFLSQMAVFHVLISSFFLLSLCPLLKKSSALLYKLIQKKILLHNYSVQLRLLSIHSMKYLFRTLEGRFTCNRIQYDYTLRDDEAGDRVQNTKRTKSRNSHNSCLKY